MISPAPTLLASPVAPLLTTRKKGTTTAAAGSQQPTKDFKIYKAVMCQYHASGRCRKGAMCTFAHSNNELRAYPDMRKHKLCAAWLTAAGCPHSAETCMYAHGVEQMQKAKLCGVNKPALCVPFFEGGGCAKGANCSFAHSIGDVDTAYQASLQQHQASLLGHAPNDCKQRQAANSKTFSSTTPTTSRVCGGAVLVSPPVSLFLSHRSSLPPPPAIPAPPALPTNTIAGTTCLPLKKSFPVSDNTRHCSPVSVVAASALSPPLLSLPKSVEYCKRVQKLPVAVHTACGEKLGTTRLVKNGSKRSNIQGETEGPAVGKVIPRPGRMGNDTSVFEAPVKQRLSLPGSEWAEDYCVCEWDNECGGCEIDLMVSPCKTATGPDVEEDSRSVRTSEGGGRSGRGEGNNSKDIAQIVDFSPQRSVASDSISFHPAKQCNNEIMNSKRRSCPQLGYHNNDNRRNHSKRDNTNIISPVVPFSYSSSSAASRGIPPPPPPPRVSSYLPHCCYYHNEFADDSADSKLEPTSPATPYGHVRGRAESVEVKETAASWKNSCDGHFSGAPKCQQQLGSEMYQHPECSHMPASLHYSCSPSVDCSTLPFPVISPLYPSWASAVRTAEFGFFVGYMALNQIIQIRIASSPQQLADVLVNAAPAKYYD
eukprot:GHVS01050249.1.p1 GENE.GHVS01050249.1~~GHVS01050249.1.p1  ORF type:complete len:652 (+),score=116.10 GHVS01050249.1:689-2644(+)